MKYIHKTLSIFIKVFFIYILFISLYKNNFLNNTLSKIINDWLYIVIPSISISYITSSFLYNYPLLSIILYPILSPILHFENKKACSLFLISIIIGEPSISKLINNAVENNEISVREGNRLMRFTSFISPIFLLNILNFYLALIIIIIQLIINLIIGYFSKNYKISTNIIKSKNILDIYFNIINELPTLLLCILISMIICNIFKNSFDNIYLSNYFEITSGIVTFNELNDSYLKFFSILTIVITLGVAIILQIYWILKKTDLSFNNFLKYRIIACGLSMIISVIIYLFIFFS